MTRALSIIFLFAAGAAHSQDARETKTPWIHTAEPLVLLSANDGQSHQRFNAEMKLDTENVTKDSVSVVLLGPDHPPIVRTVYGTVPNTISGSPHMAVTGDGRYGFVTSLGSGTSKGEPENLMSVIDLASPDLTVIDRVEIPKPTMADAHPDGKRIIVPYASGFRVFEMLNGKAAVVRDNPTDFSPGSIDVSPRGDRIIATGRAGDGPEEVRLFSYEDGRVTPLAKVDDAAGRFRDPFSPRFSPDGARVLVLNGGGSGTKGILDEVLVADVTTSSPRVAEVVPHVGDGLEASRFTRAAASR